MTASQIAVISDIHGNIDALRAVLDDIGSRGISDIINLGDHLSGPLSARETAELLMQTPMTSIRGNHDRILVEQPVSDMAASDRGAFGQLDPDHLDWLRAMPASDLVQGQVFLCHATPHSDTRTWMEAIAEDGTVSVKPQAEIDRLASGLDYPVLLCGHTHLPRMVRISGDRVLVNPGSVGCPAYEASNPYCHRMQSGSPDADYAVLTRTDGRWSVSFQQVPYDAGEMISQAQAAGRADWVQALETGRIG